MIIVLYAFQNPQRLRKRQQNSNRMVIAAALVEDEDKTDGVTIRDAVQMSELATIENHLSKEKTEQGPRTVWANVRFSVNHSADFRPRVDRLAADVARIRPGQGKRTRTMAIFRRWYHRRFLCSSWATNFSINDG